MGLLMIIGKDRIMKTLELVKVTCQCKQNNTDIIIFTNLLNQCEGSDDEDSDIDGKNMPVHIK